MVDCFHLMRIAHLHPIRNLSFDIIKGFHGVVNTYFYILYVTNQKIKPRQVFPTQAYFYKVRQLNLYPAADFHGLGHPINRHHVSSSPHIDIAILFVHAIDTLESVGHNDLELLVDFFL